MKPKYSNYPDNMNKDTIGGNKRYFKFYSRKNTAIM